MKTNLIAGVGRKEACQRRPVQVLSIMKTECLVRMYIVSCAVIQFMTYPNIFK